MSNRIIINVSQEVIDDFKKSPYFIRRSNTPGGKITGGDFPGCERVYFQLRKKK